MTEISRAAISLFPVLIFLAVLILLDSYKLTSFQSVLKTIIAGSIAAVASLLINTNLSEAVGVRVITYSRYLAPIIEETLKGICVVYLVSSRKVGFLVDAAIFGFAVGTGFGCAENAYYLYTLRDPNIALWMVRGFGTAAIHGGTTVIFALISLRLSNIYQKSRFLIFLPGLLSAVAVHSLYNHFILSPIWSTITVLVVVPIMVVVVFDRSEKGTRNWLGVGMDADIEMLETIQTGGMSETRIGRYLESLKSKFPGEVVADMFCLLRIHLELSLRAKGVLLMRHAGFKCHSDPEIQEKFDELKYLEKSIGTTGKLAITPMLRTSSRDLWQIYFLRQ